MIKELILELLREELKGEARSDPSGNGKITDSAIGKYVIVRSRNEGVNAGFLDSADPSGCVLSEARRLWYHRPPDKSESWYEGVANHGLSKDSKLSPKCRGKKYIVEDYSITVCSDKASSSIRAMKNYEQ